MIVLAFDSIVQMKSDSCLMSLRASRRGLCAFSGMSICADPSTSFPASYCNSIPMSSHVNTNPDKFTESMQKPSTKNINFLEIGPHRHCEEAHLCCIQVECFVVNVVSCSNNALNLPLPAVLCRPTSLRVCCFWLAVV